MENLIIKGIINAVLYGSERIITNYNGQIEVQQIDGIKQRLEELVIKKITDEVISDEIIKEVKRLAQPQIEIYAKSYLNKSYGELPYEIRTLVDKKAKEMDIAITKCKVVCEGVDKSI